MFALFAYFHNSNTFLQVRTSDDRPTDRGLLIGAAAAGEEAGANG